MPFAVLQILFWVAVALILWTQLGYALALMAIARMLGDERRPTAVADATLAALPRVALIVAAHDEQSVIAAKVCNALALDYPRELLQLIVACDGCSDATADHARRAGADLVLELPRGGKIRAQDAAVRRAAGQLLAFSDANSLWEADALRTLAGAFADPRVGYACGQVRFYGAGEGPGAQGAGEASGAHRTNEGPWAQGAGEDPGATNQERVYWRYEMAVRACESRLCSITAGNGAIYAVRREAYVEVDPIMGHDLSLPFRMVKRGLRAVYVPAARASERMVPSIEGEFARKRRIMSHTWPILLRGGMLSPRGYPFRYTLMIFSHRLLRYLTPALHLLALAVNVALVAQRPTVVYLVTLALQLALLAAAWLGGRVRARAPLIARYYVLTTASLAAGLWDWLAHGTDAAWDAAEGTR